MAHFVFSACNPLTLNAKKSSFFHTFPCTFPKTAFLTKVIFQFYIQAVLFSNSFPNSFPDSFPDLAWRLCRFFPKKIVIKIRYDVHIQKKGCPREQPFVLKIVHYALCVISPQSPSPCTSCPRGEYTPARRGRFSTQKVGHNQQGSPHLSALHLPGY